MTKKQIKSNKILILGLIGIFATIITAISDVFLLGRPTDAREFFMLNTKIMVYLETWRISLGTIMGIISLPFQALGLVLLYDGIREANKYVRYLIVILIGHGLTMGIAFHTSYAFIGNALKLQNSIGADNTYYVELINKFNFYWNFIIAFIAIEVLISSIFYIISVLNKKTIYPKWMAMLNPIGVLILVYLFLIVLPKPFGGYIAPAYFHIGIMFFYTILIIFHYRETY